MARSMKRGSLSQSFNIFVLDSSKTTPQGLTGLVYNTSSLICYYVQPGGAAVSVSLATLAAANSAFSSGGFKEIDSTHMPGLYRFDPPNAALSGADEVDFMFSGAANMVPVAVEVDLRRENRSGMAQAGASGTITLDSSASANNDAYTGLYIAIIAGTGSGQIREITGYVGSTKVASVTPNWSTAPDSSSVFAIFEGS